MLRVADYKYNTSEWRSMIDKVASIRPADRDRQQMSFGRPLNKQTKLVTGSLLLEFVYIGYSKFQIHPHWT